MITFIRGLPGSGKSTLARALADHYGALHLEADQYFVRNGVYRFDGARIAEAHALCRNTMREYARSGVDVFVANTFTQRRELEGYIGSLPQGKPWRVIACTAQGASVHGVPDDVLARMAERWETWERETLYDWRAPTSETPAL